MRYDVENWSYYVQTPKGRGHVISFLRDDMTLKNAVLVKLDNNKGFYEFTEDQITMITANNNAKEVKMEGYNKQPLVKDEDVIKALECCQLSNTHQVEDCDNCPFNELPQTICQNLLAYHALQIIKRGTR